jgi:hypothetical protein
MTSFQPDCLLWRTISRSWTWPAPCVSNLYGRKQLKTAAAGTVRESEDGHAKRQTLGWTQAAAPAPAEGVVGFNNQTIRLKPTL